VSLLPGSVVEKTLIILEEDSGDVNLVVIVLPVENAEVSMILPPRRELVIITIIVIMTYDTTTPGEGGAFITMLCIRTDMYQYASAEACLHTNNKAAGQ
jgi:hypothetical protein